MPLDVAQQKKPRPAYFLVRNTGHVVPLVAVDELPPEFELVGIPRSIKLEDTIGMVNLGLQSGSGAFYQIAPGYGRRRLTATRRDSKVAKTVDQFPHNSGQTPPSNSPPIPTPPGDSGYFGRGHPPASRLAHRPTAKPTVQTKLCRHWCHHGICKWGQKCRYDHIMPTTLSSLRKVGLDHWPAWYWELNPGYPVSRTMAVKGGQGGRLGRAASNAGSECCGSHRTCAVKAERLRGDNKVVVKEWATSEDMLSEELDEQILDRLKKIESGSKANPEKSSRISSSILVERAMVKNTRKWEDQNETPQEDAVKESKGEARGDIAKEAKLVEV